MSSSLGVMGRRPSVADWGDGMSACCITDPVVDISLISQSLYFAMMHVQDSNNSKSCYVRRQIIPQKFKIMCELQGAFWCTLATRNDTSIQLTGAKMTVIHCMN